MLRGNRGGRWKIIYLLCAAFRSEAAEWPRVSILKNICGTRLLSSRVTQILWNQLRAVSRTGEQTGDNKKFAQHWWRASEAVKQAGHTFCQWSVAIEWFKRSIRGIFCTYWFDLELELSFALGGGRATRLWTLSVCRYQPPDRVPSAIVWLINEFSCE